VSGRLLIHIEGNCDELPAVQPGDTLLTDREVKASQQHVKLDDFIPQTVFEQAHTFFLSMAHFRMPDGRCFKDSFSEESDWWTQKNWFYHGSYESIHLGNAYKISLGIRTAIEQLDPSGLELYTSSLDVMDIVRSLADKKKLPFIVHDIRPWYARILELGNPLTEWKRLFGHSYYRFRYHSLWPDIKACDVVLFHGMVVFQKRLSADGEKYLSIPYFGDLKESLEKRGLRVNTIVVSDRWIPYNLRRLARKSGILFLENGFPLTELLSRFVRYMGGVFFRKNRPVPTKISEIMLGKVLERKLESFERYRKPYFNMVRRTIEHILSIMKPRVGVVMGEAESMGKNFTLACKRFGIPTLGLSHGFNHSMDYARCHDIHDFSTRLPECLPDVTAVFGPFSRRMLMEHGHYPARTIEVTGSPRENELIAARNKKADQGYNKRYGIPSDCRRIVLTTQPLPLMQERIAILRDCCRAMAARTDEVLIVKPHPVEKDLGWMKVIAGEEKVKPVFITDADIYEVLIHADLLITHNSATAVEALALNVPVIILNTTGSREILPFTSSKACYEVDKGEKFGDAIAKVLYNETFRKTIEKTAVKFVYDQLYRLDGKAGERIMKIALKLGGWQ